jgi:hypothetical protein
VSDSLRLHERKLGRNPSDTARLRHCLKLADYVNLAKLLPQIPPESDWTKPVQKWGTLGNDSYGDCVFAAKAHLIHSMSACKGRETTIPEKDVVSLYLKYSPNDNGYNIEESFSILRKTGMWGHKIWAYAAVDLRNHDLVRAAIYLFGGIDVGVNLPRGWQSAKVWDAGAGRPGSWGGHDIWVPQVSADSVTCITWGNEQEMTLRGMDYYCDEAFVCISPDWLAPGGTAPNGFSLETLKADFYAITT